MRLVSWLLMVLLMHFEAFSEFIRCFGQAKSQIPDQQPALEADELIEVLIEVDLWAIHVV